jgi:DnaJ-class molecular chaperone
MSGWDSARLEREADRARCDDRGVIECPDCYGRGDVWAGSSERKCPTCHGLGCVDARDRWGWDR